MPLLTGLLVALVVAMTGVYQFKHATDASPALLTPGMDLHHEYSDGLASRAARFAQIPGNLHVARPKLIALTFDDGPYPVFTPLLLDELHALHVPATFFLIGRDAEQWPELTKRILADGNEIADHTYSHPDLDHENADEVREEITHGRNSLWRIAADPSERTLMRPPHGRFTLATLKAAQSLDYDVVLWTDDTGDWKTVTPQQIESHMERYATTPEIVLLHSGKLSTVEAMPDVIARFRRAGYTFVTAGEMIRRVAPYALNHPYRTPLAS